MLAQSCARGNAAAIAEVEKRVEADLVVAARRVASRGLDVDDLRQELHERMFVAREGRPRIAEYTGRGSLRAWLRVSIARLVVDHARKLSGHEPTHDGVTTELMERADDPESRYLKTHYRRELARAFEAAFRSLSAEQRNLLRHRYVERLGIDVLARMRGVHRATAARRIRDAEEALHRETRARLEAELRVSPVELTSIMRLIQSQMHVSVARVFASA